MYTLSLLLNIPAVAEHDYIISGGKEGKSRLNVLADVLHHQTKALLQQHGLTKGMSFLDLGCGGGNVSLMAAGMVGNNGSVTAMDFDKEIISLAQEDATAAYAKNVSFHTMSAYDISYTNQFDIAYSRFLLSHLNDPAAVLQKMKQSVKPGGKVIVEDVDFSGHFCYPANVAFNQYLQYYAAAAKHSNADANIGPSLFSMFQTAGFEDVGFDVIQPCFNKGTGKWMAYLTLDRIKPTLIKDGIATEQTINTTLQQLEGFTKDEQTIISLPRIFRVWGMNKG